MATRAARNAAVTANGTALSAYVDSQQFTRDIETADTTTYSTSSNARTHIVTLQGATLSLSGAWDPASSAAASVIEAIISAGTPVTWVHYAGGTASGQRSHSFSGIVTNYTESSDVGDKVAWSAEVLATGDITVAAL